jgi:hypothetical protein
MDQPSEQALDQETDNAVQFIRLLIKLDKKQNPHLYKKKPR